MSILIVEDESSKFDEVSSAIRELNLSIEISCARSVRSAIDHFRNGFTAALIILDMSLPTFDIEPGESGGVPKPFGGIEIMRYLKRIEVVVPTIVLTGYPSFEDDTGVVTLDELEQTIRSEFGDSLHAVIQYSVVSDDWVQRLEIATLDVLGKHK